MAGFPTGRVVQDATFIGFRGSRGLAFQEWDTRLFFNEPHGTIGFVLVPPWSAADVEIGTHTIPLGFNILLWIVQYQNPPTQHYWTCRYNATLGTGLSRWEFAAAASGSEEIAYHDDPAFKPERFEPRGVVVRWTSGLAGQIVPVQLVVNASFEISLSGWVGVHPYGLANNPGGGHALKVLQLQKVAGGAAGSVAQTIPVSPGSAADVSVLLRGQIPAQPAAGALATAYSPATNTYLTSAGTWSGTPQAWATELSGTSFVQHDVSTTVPVGETAIDLRIDTNLTTGYCQADLYTWTEQQVAPAPPGGEGELGLPSNTMDIFVGTLTAEMSQGVSIQLGVRPTPILDGGRMQWNTLGARLSSIFSTADVYPNQRIVGWWNEQRQRFL